MKSKREELLKKLHEIQNEEKIIHKEINKIDYNKKSKDATEFVGTYYQQINNRKDWIQCIHIYDVRKPDCSLIGISLHYSTNDVTYFAIEQYHHFKPKDEDGISRYKKISKVTFEKHYKEVQKRISNILKTK